MSDEKREKMRREGRLEVLEDGTEVRHPDPAVADADYKAAVEAGQIDAQGNPTDVEPGTQPEDGNAVAGN